MKTKRNFRIVLKTAVSIFLICSLIVPQISLAGTEADSDEGRLHSVINYPLAKGGALEFDEATGTILSYNDRIGEETIIGATVIIPGKINNIPVKAIGDWAFNESFGLASVIIQSGVEKIGEGAFCDCAYLMNVELPDTLTDIGSKAFANTELTTLRVPGSVKNMEGAFSNSYLKKIIIGEGMTEIPAYTFNDYPYLKEVILPGSLRIIGEKAFASCAELIDLIIPEGVTSMGEDLFFASPKLRSITIPSTVTSMYKALSESGIVSAVIAEGTTSIPYGAFYGCDALRSVIIPDSVTSIGDYAFYGCGLKDFIVPDSVTEIGDYAFSNYGLLENIVIPSSVKKMGIEVFYNYNTTILHVTEGSYAHNYAVTNSLKYSLTSPPPAGVYKISGKVISSSENTKPSIVRLMQEAVVIKSVQVSADGSYEFTNIPSGLYNLIITKVSHLPYAKVNLFVDNKDIVLSDVTMTAGDIDGNRQVNVSDLSLLLAEYNKAVTNNPCDIDGSGQVNVNDLSALLSGYNKSAVISNDPYYAPNYAVLQTAPSMTIKGTTPVLLLTVFDTKTNKENLMMLASKIDNTAVTSANVNLGVNSVIAYEGTFDDASIYRENYDDATASVHDFVGTGYKGTIVDAADTNSFNVTPGNVALGSRIKINAALVGTVAVPTTLNVGDVNYSTSSSVLSIIEAKSADSTTAYAYSPAAITPDTIIVLQNYDVTSNYANYLKSSRITKARFETILASNTIYRIAAVTTNPGNATGAKLGNAAIVFVTANAVVDILSTGKYAISIGKLGYFAEKIGTANPQNYWTRTSYDYTNGVAINIANTTLTTLELGSIVEITDETRVLDVDGVATTFYIVKAKEPRAGETVLKANNFANLVALYTESKVVPNTYTGASIITFNSSTTEFTQHTLSGQKVGIIKVNFNFTKGTDISKAIANLGIVAGTIPTLSTVEGLSALINFSTIATNIDATATPAVNKLAVAPTVTYQEEAKTVADLGLNDTIKADDKNKVYVAVGTDKDYTSLVLIEISITIAS